MLLWLSSLTCVCLGQWLRVGDVPRGHSCTRIVVLRNLRSKGPVEVSWDCSNGIPGRGIVKVYPKAGTILPRDLAVIRITFAADCLPEVFEEDVACTVRLTQVAAPSGGVLTPVVP